MPISDARGTVRLERVVLVPVSSPFFARNFLRTSALSALAEGGAFRLVLLAPAEKLDYYRREFPQACLTWDLLPDAARAPGERLFRFLDGSLIHTRTTRYLLATQMYRDGSSAPLARRSAEYALGRALSWCGQFRCARILARALYRAIRTELYASVFERYKPDAVFCPTMVYEDQLILREAKAAGIPTLGMVLSWDNLTSKTFFRVVPDHLFVHNERIREEAARFADYPKERTTVVGMPQYDAYMRRERIVSRELFCREIGADPSRPIILYAFSGKSGLPIDREMLALLAADIKSGALPHELQVLVRPYPKADLSREELRRFRDEYGFLGEPAAAHVGRGTKSWEFDERALAFSRNSLAHADVVINMYSTYLIEAALFDKPTIAIAFDGDHPRSFWNSARRFFEWDHLAALGATGGIALAASHSELCAEIRTALAHPERRREGRLRLVREQCQFLDGASGERLVRALKRSLDA